MPLRNRPLRDKLMVVILLTTACALLLASAGFLVWDLVRFRAEIRDDLMTQAEIIAENSTAALSFNDPAAALETLETLKVKQSVDIACIYDLDGRVFAEYFRAAPATCAASIEPDGYRFDSRSLVLYQSIRLAGRPIGTLYLHNELDEMYRRLRVQVSVVIVLLLGSFLVALVLSSRLQKVVSAPVLHLAETARAVSERQDFALRANRPPGHDELGLLVDSFNEMLAQIQRRDAALVQAKGMLEHRVEERTLQLKQELAERQRAEEELERRNVELMQSNRDLDDFAHIASHDLKEPLRGIHNYAVFLAEDYGDRFDEEGYAKLRTLSRLSRRMEELIDSLLYFSRVGRGDLALARVDLNRVVSEVLESLEIGLRERRVAVQIAHELPKIVCDRVRVAEVFRNLITNAMKYNDKPERCIEIGVLRGEEWRAHAARRESSHLSSNGRAGTDADPVHNQSPQAPADGRHVFYVRDNGIGIPEKHYDTVFRIFKRLHPRDSYGGGTGAGLTIVKKIVERHGGDVWIQSSPQVGTTVYFTLEGDLHA